jgi:osmotically-inducible protein OsmY
MSILQKSKAVRKIKRVKGVKKSIDTKKIRQKLSTSPKKPSVTSAPSVTSVKASKDQRLEAKIVAQLQTLSGRRVQIAVSKGFVTLTGSVNTFRQKERLHRFVMRLHGVRALKDILKIDPLESVEDRKIASLVRNALDAHAELPQGTIVLHVCDGVVTLNGHVRTLDERSIAEYVTSHSRGVIRVVNEVTVDPLDEIGDHATCRAVRGAINYCDEFEIELVSVSCADGYIVLRGEVPTLLDRTLVEELAKMQYGVRGVENHIVVSGFKKG